MRQVVEVLIGLLVFWAFIYFEDLFMIVIGLAVGAAILAVLGCGAMVVGALVLHFFGF